MSRVLMTLTPSKLKFPDYHNWSLISRFRIFLSSLIAMLKIVLSWTMSKLSLSKIKFSIILLLYPNHASSKCLLNQTWRSFGLIYGISKVTVKPRLLLTNASTSVGSLQLLEVLTWILGFHNVKIARNGVIPYSHVESKRSNALSTTGSTNPKTIISSASIAKLTQRQILLALKQRKANCVLIHSIALTVEMIVKQIQTHVPFGDIGSTESGTRRNTLKSVKTGPNQFVQS